jgi:hypothetical protein
VGSIALWVGLAAVAVATLGDMLASFRSGPVTDPDLGGGWR